MYTNFLSNPAPSNGYNAIMGAIAPHAAPAEGSLGGTNPSVHNRVKQTFVNPVASYPFIASKWSDHFEVSFHEGDLMFVFTGAKADKSSKTTILANLPTLNHIMRCAHMDASGKYAEFADTDDWQYIGVMRNSSAAANESTFNNGSRRGGNAVAPDRIINIDVRGATRMFNYWEQARAGDAVWLAWRQVAMNAGRKRTFDSLGSASEKPDGDDISVCWQLLPWSNKDLSPQNVHWHNQVIASPTLKRPIRVGWIYQTIGAGEMSKNHVAIRKATQISEERFKLPMLHAFVRV